MIIDINVINYLIASEVISISSRPETHSPDNSTTVFCL